MTFLNRAFAAASLPLAACASVGPTTSQLRQAIAETGPSAGPSPEIRHLTCETFQQEPTELLCRWRQLDPSGAWRTWTTYLAVDARGYHLIDDVVEASEPPRAEK